MFTSWYLRWREGERERGEERRGGRREEGEKERGRERGDQGQYIFFKDKPPVTYLLQLGPTS